MIEIVKVILPKTKKEVDEADNLMEKGGMATGVDAPTKEQLDKYPLEYFND